MPTHSNNIMFYSFNLATVHFVSVNIELYYLPKLNHQKLKVQYNWLREDLAKAASKQKPPSKGFILYQG